jgi:hypothetical protein
MNTLFSRTQKSLSMQVRLGARKYFSASVVAPLEKNGISGLEVG